jgi:hypothetical protein
MLIFVPIFCALFEEKLNKLLDQINNSQISIIQPYRISGSSIWYPTGYQERPDIRPAGYRCIPNFNVLVDASKMNVKSIF